MAIRAPSSGIILEVNGSEGEKVNTDRLLVRMSDLSTFKLIASIEDVYDDVTKTGRGVLALIDGERLTGKIGTISPSIKDGKIEFDVFLDQSDYFKLRPNLSIDLLVIQAQKDSVHRIKKGPAFGEGDMHEVYFIKSGKAMLKNVKTGLSGNEYLEIEEGVELGDELIISDISSLRKLEEIEIN
jgi:HlyD family secretion protein